MKVTVMRLDGTSFNIEVKPDATVEDLKKKIEEDQGSEVYPVCRQILTYDGKFFKNETTLVEYNVTEGSSIVIMGKLQESIQLLQDSPELLLPFLEELARQVPNVPRYNPNHLAEFQRFFREACGEERNSGQLPNAVPPADELTPEEEESIERIVAFVRLDRDVVLEKFLACNKVKTETALQLVLNQLPERPNAVPVPPAVELTPEEEESIDHIVAQVGLDRDVVLEEFLACNKDETETLRQLLPRRFKEGDTSNSGQLPNAVPPAVEPSEEGDDTTESDSESDDCFEESMFWNDNLVKGKEHTRYRHRPPNNRDWYGMFKKFG